jgi:hypothetical protein
MPMKIRLQKLKATIKQILLTKEGWFAWIVANVITSMPWFLPLVYGFVFKDERGYVAAAAVYAFILAPFTPFWILNIIIATLVLKLLGKKHIKQGG